MKTSTTKYIIGAIVVVIVALYAVWSGDNNSSAASSVPPLAVGTPSSSSTPSISTTSGTSTGAGTPPPTGSTDGSSSTPSAGHYKDGTYTGSVADAFYGQLQVVATVSGGKLASMTFPVYPDDPGHSSDLSAQALPELAQEAIAAQNANVQIVSGATQDSEAFRQSLASALAQAKS